MRLYYRMPIIQFKPTHVQGEQKIKKGQNLYTCPTYMYPIRTGVREKPSYMFSVMLPIKPGVNTTSSSDQDFWAKRGTALLMSLAGEEI
jgi:dynein heavy chain